MVYDKLRFLLSFLSISNFILSFFSKISHANLHGLLVAKLPSFAFSYITSILAFIISFYFIAISMQSQITMALLYLLLLKISINIILDSYYLLETRRIEMANKTNTKSFYVRDSDPDVKRWVENQHNISESLRLVIKNVIHNFGESDYLDAVNTKLINAQEAKHD